ncbi:uncharacterized protein DEA37_0010468 [Paragonimus westermani]|uniref:Integrase catalytic domain-containing protein n=1 Tax=Paragonimus westermani TaxID=34504 RepID=A0A5J4N4J8_9TREM|nr:uncharacterized protein DEA37_0010468 [Paragonimus westermani]
MSGDDQKPMGTNALVITLPFEATATSTIIKLRATLATFGVPETIVADNGSLFTSAEFEDFISSSGSIHIVKNMLEKQPNAHLRVRLDRALFAHRNLANETTNSSLVELMIGLCLCTRLDLLHESPQSKVVVKQELVEILSTCVLKMDVGFCSAACEEASWAPLWFEDGTKAEEPELSVGRSRHPSHRFECGQVHRLCLRDYAGWKHMRSQPPPVFASDALKSYHAQLRECSVDSCVGGPTVAWLSFAVVARTNPVTLRNLAQNLTDSTSMAIREPLSSPLLAFSGARHRPACDSQADDYSTVGWLTSNSNKRTPHDLWQRTVAAVFLTYCLSVRVWVVLLSGGFDNTILTVYQRNFPPLPLPRCMPPYW